MAVTQLYCGDTSPTASTPLSLSTTAFVSDAGPAGSDVTAHGTSNSAPRLVLNTRPGAVPGDPYPVISGKAPLEVNFNLCRSSDADSGPAEGEGDSLNWQFHFGDDGTGAINPDGSFHANVGQQCRTAHTYEEGRYVATVSVTDKHLEDQGNELSSLARVTQRLTVVVSGRGADAPGSSGTSAELTTLFATNNNFAGNTFDLQASVPLQITGFSVNLNTPGSTNTIAVYWRTGSANGNESNPAGWTLLGRDTGVISAGTNAPSMVNVGGLAATPGQVYGIYVDVESYPSASLLYTNGGPNVFANADLSLTTYHGKGTPAFAGATFFPRQWNGTVHYVK